MSWKKDILGMVLMLPMVGLAMLGLIVIRDTTFPLKSLSGYVFFMLTFIIVWGCLVIGSKLYWEDK